MDPIEQFREETRRRVSLQGKNAELNQVAQSFLLSTVQSGYSYNFTWMGRPIIQYPQDMVAMQEIIWNVKPDLIIETGIAHGGSLIFYASIMELIGHGEVLGIDIDIRAHNKAEIESHPMKKRISMIEGSSIASQTIQKVKKFAEGKQRILVTLDSNHSHDHVLSELEQYSNFVSLGSYLVVFDTVVEDFPAGTFPGRPWDKGNNSKTAVSSFLQKSKDFEIDSNITDKILVSVAPGGYLKRISK
ncbi:MAG TPA: cephalosporin hydroxylase family protein [Flavitalea sp.]|nr:cephalosporin hydroxylase family protein [Flavitalea sp.]